MSPDILFLICPTPPYEDFIRWRNRAPMSYETILFEKAGGVAKITLNRPETFNALSLDLGEELFDAVTRCHSDAEVRAVVITGTGKAFSAGGDIRSMAEALKGDVSSVLRQLAAVLANAMISITRLPKPVVAAVNGTAAGAGLALVLASDMAIASEKAKFVVAFTGIALSPDSSTTFFLPRYVGLKKAMELTLTNRPLSAQEAADMGIINEVVAEGEFAARVDSFAATLAQGPTIAFGKAKQLLHRGLSERLETQVEDERHIVADCGLTADFREAVNAFLEKRTPRFQGR